MQNKNLNLIQVLRGIASLLVVLLHATVNLNEIIGTHFIFDFFTFGGAGVDIFFVLSGFIITFTSIKNAGDPSKLLPFLKRRAVRIFPTYWIIITGFLALQLMLPGFYRTHFDFSFSNLMSTYLLFFGHIMVNGVSWSLSYELFFYVLFSLFFLFSDRKWPYFFFIIYCLVLIALPLAGYHFEKSNNWLTVVASPMNIEFFMGVIAALIIPHVPFKFSTALIILGSILFITCGILYNQRLWILFEPLYRSFTFGLASFFIITGIVRYEISRKINVHNVLLLLGEASYSLYLLHLPIIVAGLKVFSLLNIKGTVSIHIAMFALVAAICLLSVYFYRWVEKPLINKLNAFFSEKPGLKKLTAHGKKI
jgi:exopolysaccharide production protein ExoZ